MNKPTVVIVNGYGTILDSPLGNLYLPMVLRVIQGFVGPDLVVFCGGYTFAKTMPKDSEASIMFEWIDRALRGSPSYRQLLIENNSYTTLENSREAAKKIRSIFKEGVVRVVHCCEATRSANVIMCDRHFMMGGDQPLVEGVGDITVATASWEMADPFRQAQGLIYNKLALKYPWLGLAERDRRKRLEASKRR